MPIYSYLIQPGAGYGYNACTGKYCIICLGAQKKMKKIKKGFKEGR
jgi:hypothetical protein